MASGTRAAAGTAARGWLFDQPYLLLSLTSLFWAGNTILGRFIVGHVPPMTLAFIRWTGADRDPAAVRVRNISRATGRSSASMPALMTLLALTGFSAYNTMAYYGLQYTTAINGLLLQSVAPLFVAMWTFALFGERLTLRQAGGICVSLIGVLVIICHGSLAVLLGDRLQPRRRLVSGRAGDLRPTTPPYLRKRPPMHPLSFLAVGMGCGAVLLIPVVVLGNASGRTVVFDARAVASFAFVCIFPSLLGYLFLNRGIELIGANRAAPFIHLVPVFGSVLAIVCSASRSSSIRRSATRWCSPASRSRRASDLHHSALMPASLITLAHLAASPAINLANSADVFGAMVSAPRSARRFLTSGSAMAALTALLSVSMIVGRRAFRRAEADPGYRLIARHELGHASARRAARRGASPSSPRAAAACPP